MCGCRAGKGEKREPCAGDAVGFGGLSKMPRNLIRNANVCLSDQIRVIAL